MIVVDSGLQNCVNAMEDLRLNVVFLPLLNGTGYSLHRWRISRDLCPERGELSKQWLPESNNSNFLPTLCQILLCYILYNIYPLFVQSLIDIGHQ